MHAIAVADQWSAQGLCLVSLEAQLSICHAAPFRRAASSLARAFTVSRPVCGRIIAEYPACLICLQGPAESATFTRAVLGVQIETVRAHRIIEIEARRELPGVMRSRSREG